MLDGCHDVARQRRFLKRRHGDSGASLADLSLLGQTRATAGVVRGKSGADWRSDETDVARVGLGHERRVTIDALVEYC